jgi:hypothetical protein
MDHDTLLGALGGEGGRSQTAVRRRGGAGVGWPDPEAPSYGGVLMSRRSLHPFMLGNFLPMAR